MGVCFTTNENKIKLTEKKISQHFSPNNEIGNLNVDKDCKPHPITEDAINRSIDQWKEKTKRRKFKSDLPIEFLRDENYLINKEADNDLKGCLDAIKEFEKESVKQDTDILHLNANLFLNQEKIIIDYSNGEIRHDFININKQGNNKGFSDISSTIHFTFLNSKDLASSKIQKIEKNIINNISLKSQSIYNVLDELNNINKFENIKFVIKNNGKQKLENGTKKILISNNAIFKTQPPKEYSVNLNEKSKLTIKKRDYMLPMNQMSITQNNNQHQLNSYIINNRTLENGGNITEEDISKNNLAAIQSSNSTNQEFLQENVFYNIDKLNTNEIIIIPKKNREEILEQLSIINNVKYPPWNKEIHESILHYKKSKNEAMSIYDDIDGIKIDWMKNNILNSLNNSSKNFIFYLNDAIINIKQGIANNCSLIAALIEISNYSVQFKRDLISSIIFPQEDMDKNLTITGFYGVKLYLNSSCRIIDVDETMPYNKNNGKRIFSNSDYFFINIIEKSIFKLYNGIRANSSEITFNLNSNPSFEIYHLTGWIPEIMMFEDVENKINLWQRLYSNFKEGNIMVCLGTADFKDSYKLTGSCALLSSSTDLISNHSYSVLEVCESSDERLMKCKNPWGHTVPLLAKTNSKLSNDEFYLKRDSKEAENGIFWIEWENIFDNFKYIFLAWNPDIYSYKYSFISSYKNYKSQSKFYDELYSLEYNSQFVITIPEHKEDFEMRVLLTRHINTFENNDISKRKSISFKLFWFEGYQIVYPVDYLRVLKSSKREINSDVFIFEGSDQVEQYVLVVLKNDSRDENSEVTFSLDFLSFVDIDVKELPKKEIIKSYKLSDSWDNKPGGNLRSLNFINNPQYKLTINNLTHLQIKVETELMTPIMLCIIDNGNHISKIPYQNIINSKHPGFFFNSFSYIECMFEPGEYNLVCGSQEEKHVGRYYLEINEVKNAKTSNKSEFKIEKLKLQSYNFVEHLKGKWDKQNQIRQKYISSEDKFLKKNPGFSFNLTQKTKAKFILRATANINSNLKDYPNLAVYLFKIEGNEKYKLMFNGSNLASSAWGFHSDEIELEPCPHGYKVLCINLSKSSFIQFELEIHSQHRLFDIVANTKIEFKRRNFNIYGKWAKSNSGGGPDNILFCKNLQYEISVNKRTSAQIELISHDSFLVSIMILDYDKSIDIKNMCELNWETIKESYSLELNNLEYDTETKYVNTFFEDTKKYLIIPFTKIEDQIGNFDMIISTDEEVTVKELDQKAFYSSKCLTLRGKIIDDMNNIFKCNNVIYPTKHLSYIYVKFDSNYSDLNFHLKNSKDNKNLKFGIIIYDIIQNNKFECHSSYKSFSESNYTLHFNYLVKDSKINREILLVITIDMGCFPKDKLFEPSFHLMVDSGLNNLEEFKQVNQDFFHKIG